MKSMVYLLLFVLPAFAGAQTFSLSATDPLMILYSSEGPKLDSIAAQLLAGDIERVTGRKPPVISDASKAKGNVIVIGNISSSLTGKFISKSSTFYQQLQGKWECYGLKIIDKPSSGISKILLVAGSDARGTAYGVFAVSGKIGVSPWYWWADVQPKKQPQLTITQQELVSSPPAVKYRGIFINDEDWGLQPWAAKTFEPETGDIGPRTYARVFELLLRLKANLIWPAMHPSTKAFFHYPGNVTTAGDYQVIIGSSHAEPMLRNNVSEWDEKSMGHFNYFSNKEKILNYWEQRIRESRGINAIYTMGMRGVHDSQMEGVKDLKEAVPVVEGIINDERGLLAKHINPDVTSVPQVLTPYKEVLEIYDNGLKVPEDITLVWPDDNYGYIHRLNNEKEQARKGGAGVYYHASYWGRPHDYLWLPSTHPSLMQEEMMKAFETGADRLWVLNVGDIKPIEYNTQLFLDMAYDPAPFRNSSYTKQHLLQWATSVFGVEKAKTIQNILWDYYRLAFERRPEFMGWSQTEPTTETKYTEFNHFYFGDEAQKRIDRYSALEAGVKKLRLQLAPKDADAFYQLVYYPVMGASWINKKFLYRDKAYFYSRQNRLSAQDYAQLSKAAYDSIVKETDFYNNRLSGGRWKQIMSMSPRNLPVYGAPVLPEFRIDSTSWSIAPEGFVRMDSSLTAPGWNLPAFDNLNRQRYFIDVFLGKNETVRWNASVSHPWIRLSKAGGLLDPKGMKQVRLWVDIDWKAFTGKGKTEGSIRFEGGGPQFMVRLDVFKRDIPAGYKGFIENNGFVALQAAHFSRSAGDSPGRWKVINGLGYAGTAVQAYPLSTAPVQKNNAFVEYDFYTFSAAVPLVMVYALPTHPLNNNFSVRYAVSLDGGPLRTVDIKTYGRSEEWKQNVLRNRAERRIEMPFLNSGKHTLRIYAVDPGVIIDEIRIDLGGLKKAYGSVISDK